MAAYEVVFDLVGAWESWLIDLDDEVDPGDLVDHIGYLQSRGELDFAEMLEHGNARMVVSTIMDTDGNEIWSRDNG